MEMKFDTFFSECAWVRNLVVITCGEPFLVETG